MVKLPPCNADAARLITADSGQFCETGTVIANYRDSLSCDLALPVDSQRGTWGGARNRADRTSDGLIDRQVDDLIASVNVALSTGRVFQRHWTVHYGLAGIQPSEGARFIGKLLDLVAKQARREGGYMSAIWVRECASGKGEHVHILLHLPVGMMLRNRTRRWIKAAGGRYRKGVSKVTLIGGRLSKVGEGSNERQVENAENVVRYILKAADADTAERLDLTRFDDGGRIVGKRCGRTQNLC